MYEGLFLNISIDDDGYLLVRKVVRSTSSLHFGKLIGF